MKNKKSKVLYVLILILFLFCNNIMFAHSGRTDSSGGHKDNKNKSGLGSYHYHCGGYPAHLHSNGICPYKTTTVVNNNVSEEEIKTEEIETVVPVLSNDVNNLESEDKSDDESNHMKTILVLGGIGGGGYIVYRKMKANKKTK